ncbi:adenosine receptor A1-like [Rhincodon typus]|uniref:adenosine receptor A1-like n=1 Tax=Rhincodon typus TaxID=259920 RepID=UPI00202F5CB3|nr:adenosine receptor A1-like [Rhincodon typus]
MRLQMKQRRRCTAKDTIRLVEFLHPLLILLQISGNFSQNLKNQIKVLLHDLNLKLRSTDATHCASRTIPFNVQLTVQHLIPIYSAQKRIYILQARRAVKKIGKKMIQDPSLWRNFKIGGVLYKIIVTQKRAWIAVGICWLGSILIGLTPMFGWHNRSNGEVQKEEMNSSYKYIMCKFTKVIRMDYMVYFNFFGWVLLPLVIMFCLYAEVFYIIRKQLNKVTNPTDSRKYFGKELKLAKSLALVLFLFVACWIPLHAMNTVWYFCPQCSIPKTAFYVGIFLSHVNSAVNPVIYAFRIKKFRTSFLQIWNKYVLCKKGTLSMYSFDGQIVMENNFNSSV